jgi:hypothetical protein
MSFVKVKSEGRRYSNMQVALLWLHGHTKRTVSSFFEHLKLGIPRRKPNGIKSINKSTDLLKKAEQWLFIVLPCMCLFSILVSYINPLRQSLKFTLIVKGDFWILFSFRPDIPHCFICRPSDSTVSEDAGIEPRTVATMALTVRRPHHLARSHPHLPIVQYF